MDQEGLINKKEAYRWLDLALYLVGGVGVYIGLSMLAGQFIHAGSVWRTYAALLLNVICLAGSVYVFGILRRRMTWDSMGLFPAKFKPVWLLWTILIVVGLLPLRGLLALLAQLLVAGNFDSVMARSELLVPQGMQGIDYLLLVLFGGILAPIAEELFFRGAIFGWLRGRFNPTIAIVFSSIAFALGHADSVGVVASSLVIGVVNAFVYEKTKSLWFPIAIHVVNNSFAFLLVYLMTLLEPMLL
jgi:membrane protease YdiL (CAAX protease family)